RAARSRLRGLGALRTPPVVDRRAEAHPHERSSPRRVLGLHETPRRLGGLLDDREAQARSGHPAGALRAVEAVEDVRQIGLGEAGAVVANGEDRILEADFAGPSGGTPLAGVVDEISHGTAEPRGASYHNSRAQVELDGHVAAAPGALHGGAHDGIEPDLVDLLVGTRA